MTTIGDYGYYIAEMDGIYGYSQATFLDYTFAADGLALTIGTQTTAGTKDDNKVKNLLIHQELAVNLIFTQVLLILAHGGTYLALATMIPPLRTELIKLVPS